MDYLQGYSGYLQVDGYVGYEQTQTTLVGCWAHARRKFTEAKTAQDKKPSGKADWALNHIQKLYRIETQIKDKTVKWHQNGTPLTQKWNNKYFLGETKDAWGWNKAIGWHPASTQTG